MFAFLLFSSLSEANSCKICQNTCRAIRNGLKNGYSDKDMITKYKKICDKLEGKESKYCNGVFENFESILFDLGKNMKTNKICEKHSLCENSIHDKMVEVPNFFNISEMYSGMWCSACTSFVDWMRPSVEGVSVTTVKKFLNDMCPKYPNFQDFCKTITEQQIKIFVHGVINGVTTQQFCQWVKYCP